MADQFIVVDTNVVINLYLAAGGLAGEMVSLAAIGIVEISVQGTALNVTTPRGTTLAARADFVWASGQVGRAFDLALIARAAANKNESVKRRKAV